MIVLLNACREAKRIEDIRIPVFDKFDLSIDHPLQAMVNLNSRKVTGQENNKACDRMFYQNFACWPLNDGGKLADWMLKNVPMVGM